MNKKRVLLVALLSLFFLTLGNLTARAEQSLAVSVNAVLPKNQHNKEVTYYDLRMKPGQKQELDFELTNASKKN